MSSWKDDLSTLRLLGKAGEALHVKNGAGMTPLGEIAFVLGLDRQDDPSKIGGSKALLAVLIDAGADVNAAAMNDQTPYQLLAREGRRTLLADFLEDRGARPLPPVVPQIRSPFFTAEAAVRAERAGRVTIADE